MDSSDLESCCDLQPPPLPVKPQRMPSLSQLTVGNTTKTIKLSELQAHATTGISMENALTVPSALPKSSHSNMDERSQSMGYSNEDDFLLDRTDAMSIRTTPTLTIYTDDDYDDGEDGHSFVDRLEHIMNQSSLSGLKLQFGEDDCLELDDSKQFFVLSNAGKPIYSNLLKEEEKTVGYGGIIQTFVDSFLHDGSKLKSFVAGSTRFTILNESPIILMACSKLKEEDSDLLNQLDLLYSFLLSTFSKPHIVRSFQNKESFDLGKHLGRSCVSGLDYLCKEMSSFNPGIMLGALQSIKLKKTIRDKICHSLLHNRSKDILYGVLAAPGGKLINIMRPKTHTLHTTDLQLLFLTVENQSKDQADDEELWLPICLPKFNPNGFLYAYVKYIGQVFLILVSPDKGAFFEVRDIANQMLQDMNKKKIFDALEMSISRGISTVDIPAPLVYHFIYKSKRHLQYVMPTTQSNLANSKHLYKYYLELHSSVNRNNRISISYMRWEHTNSTQLAGIGWTTPKYELFLITGSIVKKDILVKSAKSIVNWCRKHDDRLFVCQGAVF